MRRDRTIVVSFCSLVLLAGSAQADPPVASYLFPAGGQRGSSVKVLAGGLCLTKSCNFEIVGDGVSAPRIVKSINSPVFEGPLLQLPESQRQEDYPHAMAVDVAIDKDALIGPRRVRLWTSQGVTLPLPFVVGDLPEVVEEERQGRPIPVLVNPPVTINGRIHPRENVDVWMVRLTQGQTLTCAVAANSIGSPLEARLEVRDAHGRKLIESRDDLKIDPKLRFTAREDGVYAISISDDRNDGGPAFVYRLTLTTGPVIDGIFPLGGKRGETTRFQLRGSQVPDQPIAIAIPADAGASFRYQWRHGNESTNPVAIDVDDLPEATESVEENDPIRANYLPIPGIANGRIKQPGEIDTWNFSARNGDQLEIELRAYRLGSPLLGVLTIRDATKRILAQAEAGPTGDPTLRFTAPANGIYSITVEDRFRSRGGDDFTYRLRITRPAPDFELQLGLPSLTIPRGQTVSIKVTANRRGNLNGPIYLRFDGLPAGVTTVKEPIIPAGQSSVDVSLKADTTAKIESFKLHVSGIAYQPMLLFTTLPIPVTRRAVFKTNDNETLDHVRVAVALPTPFKIVGDYVLQLVPRGTVYSRRYRIERNGFAGPIEISLADRQARHLQGVTGRTIVVPGDKSEFEYAIQLPPWMDTGRTCRVCVMGTAMLKDALGNEHTITYSSREQNDQIIAVVEPERLNLQLDRQTIRVEPGSETEVPIQLGRAASLQESAVIDVEMPGHFKGVQAERLLLAGGVKQGRVRLRFSSEARGPFNAPLTIRATVMDKGLPVTAETTLELVPTR